MTHFALKLTQICNSVGVIAHKEALAATNLEKGNAIQANESPVCFQIAPYDPTFADQTEAIAGSLAKCYWTGRAGNNPFPTAIIAPPSSPPVCS